MSRVSKITDKYNQFEIYNLIDTIKGFKVKSNNEKKSKILYFFVQNSKKLIDNRYFAIFIMTTIILNSVSMGLETLYSIRERPLIFNYLEHVFNFIYNFEFLLKLYVMKLSYFKNPWNWFDLFILSIIYFEIMLNLFYFDYSSYIHKLIKSLKVFRTLKAVSYVQGLKVILSALIKTLSNSVINVVIVTLLIMFIFSIIANSLFPQEDWSSLSNSMWTLFRYICGDEWPEIQKKIDNFSGSRLFTIVFVFIGNFIFANIFIGLIIMNISEAQIIHERLKDEEKTRAIREKKENILKKQVGELAKYFEKNTENKYVGKNFSQMVENYYQNLSHSSDLIWPRKLCTNLTWLKSFLKTCKILDEQLLIVKKMHAEVANYLASKAEERLIDENIKN